MMPFVAERILNPDGSLHAVEVLLRPPGLSPLAYLRGLGPERGDVLRQHHQRALTFLHTYHEQRSLPVPRIHLNADPVDLPDFETHLRQTVLRSGLTPGTVTVELTGHTGNLASLTTLHAQGFTLALDDIGRENFGDLHLHPMFAVVKTDRAMVRRPDQLRRMIEVHLDQGQQVIVEGVETAEDERLALTSGATATQGYLHAPPLAPRARTFPTTFALQHA